MLLWQKKFSLVVKNIDCSQINGKMITLEFEGQVEFEHGHKTMGLRRGGVGFPSRINNVNKT